MTSCRASCCAALRSSAQMTLPCRLGACACLARSVACSAHLAQPREGRLAKGSLLATRCRRSGEVWRANDLALLPVMGSLCAAYVYVLAWPCLQRAHHHKWRSSAKMQVRAQGRALHLARLAGSLSCSPSPPLDDQLGDSPYTILCPANCVRAPKQKPQPICPEVRLRPDRSVPGLDGWLVG